PAAAALCPLSLHDALPIWQGTQAQPSLAQPTRSPPTSAAAMKNSFAPVVRRAAPAVVNISSKRLVRAQADPFWELFGLGAPRGRDRKSTRLNSSHVKISYA